MRPSEALQNHRASIRQIVESHHAQNPLVFGSVLHGDDSEESDLDLSPALDVIHKSDQARNFVIPAGIAGQIGRTADLHGFAARRVRDMHVPNASRSHGGQLVAEQVFDSGNFQPAVSHPCVLDTGNPCRYDGLT